ncbi:DUF2065 domain-containing protein [Marivivens sp. LCG002]|uniref:DUF2065 domain-containing protein n=1 Tax=Marivivens sp. LCG002 TaxID=3051171 RepID=UPI00255496AC|nr:DUF2065 domain-containing protein [Marivivens sp. LCG002]WIV51617.1 DUF2065 domain-containing protein [Marivivens sp. LCG002]
MGFIMLAIGLVCVVEGLAYALAPSLMERSLEVLKAMPIETRRRVGLGALAVGVGFVWAAFALGFGS